MKIIWCMIPEIWSAPNRFFLSSWAIFCPLTPVTVQKMKIEKNWKKNTWKYHHFTQVYEKSWSYAILFLRYKVRDGCNCYFSFWTIFCSFTHLTAQKNKISNKQTKKHLEISFYTRVPKTMVRWCTVPEICCTTDRWTEKVTYRGGCPT